MPTATMTAHSLPENQGSLLKSRSLRPSDDPLFPLHVPGFETNFRNFVRNLAIERRLFLFPVEGVSESPQRISLHYSAPAVPANHDQVLLTERERKEVDRVVRVKPGPLCFQPCLLKRGEVSSEDGFHALLIVGRLRLIDPKVVVRKVEVRPVHFVLAGHP